MSYILDALRKADAQRERDPARGIHAQPGRASMGDSPRGAGMRAGIWAASAAGIAALAIAGWYLYRDPVPAAGKVQVAAVPSAQPRVPSPPPAAPTVPPPVVAAPVVLPPPVVVAPTVATTPPAAMPRAAPPSRMDRPAGTPPPMPGQVGVGATARAMAQATQAMPPPAQPGAQPSAPLQGQSQMPSPGQSPAAPTAPTAPNGASAPAQAGMPAAQVAAPPPQPTPVVPNVAPQPSPYVPPVVVPASPPPAPVAGLPPDAPKLVITGGVYTTNKAQRMLIVNGQVMTEGADLGSGVTLEEIRPKSAVLRFRGGRYAVSY